MKTTYIQWIMILLSITIIFVSCKKEDKEDEDGFFFICGISKVSDRDGNEYKTVKIGNQCWMKENLRFVSQGSWSYQNDPANSAIYGRLYSQGAAKSACPTGWHLPSDDEWKILEGYVDTKYKTGDPIWNEENMRGHDVGTRLKATSGWRENGNGNNKSGFGALPGGMRSAREDILDDPFLYIGVDGYYWTSTVEGYVHEKKHYYRIIRPDEAGISRRYYLWSDTYEFLMPAFSARCVKD
jgi:uncharacterized protein (TIGR02145 family)